MRRKIKVLQVITNLTEGGAQEHMFCTSKLLDKNRFQVSILSGAKGAVESHWVGEIRKNDIYLATLPELTREIAPFQDLLTFVKMVNFIRRGKFNIVHTNSSKAGILGRSAAFLAGTPVILHTVHGWAHHDYMSRVRKKTYIILERLVGRFTNKIIAVSELNVKKGLSDRIGHRNSYFIIRSGIDLSKFSRGNINVEKQKNKWRIDAEEKVVGTITRLSQQKAPIDFIKMANIILNKNPRVTFLLVGGGPLKKEIEDTVKSLGISNKVLLTGFRSDTPELLSIMDVFTLNSLWEGLPRVLPQAMAMELPIVATCVDGVPEAIKHGQNGFLVQPGDYKSAAQYVLQLLEDKNLRIKMGETGKNIVFPEFCQMEMVRKTEELYKHLVDTKLPIKN